MFDRFSAAILRHRRFILILSLLCTLVSAYFATQVRITYSMAEYLPHHAPTSVALRQLPDAPPNLQVMIKLSPQEALRAKAQLSQIIGVEKILWLDDSQDVALKPWSSISAAQKEPYYAQEHALYTLTVREEGAADVLAAIRKLYPEAVFRGEAANLAQMTSVSMGQLASMIYYIVPVVLIILLLATDHWLEPVLFLLVIGVAIVVNAGTNIFLGGISFVTQACSAVLQLAVSIDYAVFLLHRFGEFRAAGHAPQEAMKLAMRHSASAIAASAMTTVFGFLALLVMEFGMGFDMGIVLAKGVLLSYLSVVVVLPAAVIVMQKWLDRTAHRRLLPSFEGFGRFAVRWGAGVAVIVLLFLPAAYLGQANNEFLYGSGGMHAATSTVQKEARQIEAVFGQSRQMLLLVPKNEPAKSAALVKELEKLPYVHSALSRATAAGIQVPPAMLPQRAREQLMTNAYEYIILSVETPDEGKAAFAAVEEIRAAAAHAFGENYHLLGESAVNYDLKQIITRDNEKVLLVGIIAIGLVLLVTFRSLTIPLILLLVIEGSIWLNMAWPYFTGSTLNFIGYEIVSSLQLGATVDYGILLSQRYLEGRKTKPKREAAIWALSVSTGSILPPALILTSAGYILSFAAASNGVISQMGQVIGRGAALSAAMVLLVLPQILVWLDGLIMKTTMRAGAKE